MGKSSRKKKKAPGEIGVREDRPGSSENHNSTGSTKKNSPGKTAHFKYFYPAVVSLITFLIYVKSLHNEFVNWDDPTYVVDNPYIHPFNIAF